MAKVVLELEIETTEVSQGDIIAHAVRIIQNADPQALAESCKVTE